MTNEEQKEIFSRNFRFYVDASGKEQKTIAEELNYSYTTVNTWYRGTSMPNAAKIQTLADYFGILKSDLLDDHSSKATQGDSTYVRFTPEQIRFLNKYIALDDKGKETIEHILSLETMRTVREVEMKRPIRHLAYYGKIAAAGTFIDSYELLMNGTINVEDDRNSSCADYAIGVSGDSMEPEFHDGDIVLVSKSREIAYGEIGIFQYNGSVYIKKLGCESLESLNPKYEPIANNWDIRCLGLVLGKAKVVE